MGVIPQRNSIILAAHHFSTHIGGYPAANVTYVTVAFPHTHVVGWHPLVDVDKEVLDYFSHYTGVIHPLLDTTNNAKDFPHIYTGVILLPKLAMHLENVTFPNYTVVIQIAVPTDIGVEHFSHYTGGLSCHKGNKSFHACKSS